MAKNTGARQMAAARHTMLEGQGFASRLVSLTEAAPASRISLRARPEAVAALSKALGIKLPDQPKTSVRSTAAKTKQRVALWLGPDEWLVIDEAGADLMGACAKAKGLHAAVDVSHRNTAIIVSGQGAEAVISAGCPQNLSLDAFAVGACSRTILGKAEIVLLREEDNVFRVECWRSFSAYVLAFLSDAARAPMI